MRPRVLHTREQSLQCYTDLIVKYNGQSVMLSDLLLEYRISRSVQPWIDAGIAKRIGHGKYRIYSNNPKSDAKRILKEKCRINDELRARRRIDPINNLRVEQAKMQLQTPEPKTQQEPMVQRRKIISILWGLVRIEN